MTISISSSNKSVVDTSVKTGTKKGSSPIDVGLTIKATPGIWDDVNVGLSTTTKSTSAKNDFTMKSKVKSGKIDKLAVKVDVDDWARDPGDRDDLDFLILIAGAKGGGKHPRAPVKNPKDIDLRLEIDFKGLPLKAVFKKKGIENLKLVKFIGDDGKTVWGYTGTVDADTRSLKLDLSSTTSGAKVAELALDLSAGQQDYVDGL